MTKIYPALKILHLWLYRKLGSQIPNFSPSSVDDSGISITFLLFVDMMKQDLFKVVLFTTCSKIQESALFGDVYFSFTTPF